MKRIANVLAGITCLLVTCGSLPISAQTLNYALQFDGVTDYVDLGNPPAVNFGTGDFTISFWAKPDYAGGGANYDHVVGKAAPSTYAPFIIGIHDSKWAFWSTSDPANGWNIAVEYPFGDVANNQWQHITVTRIGTTIAFYLNGNQTATLITALPLWDNPDPVLVGKIPYEAVETHYRGQMDELTIWGNGRTGEQVRESMYRTAAGGDPGLIGAWLFNEGSGTSAYNQTGNYHGTLYGSTTFVTSSAPVGGMENSQTVSSVGEVMFTGASLFAAFQAKSGTDTIKVIHLFNLPDGTQPAGVSTLHHGYWIVQSTPNGAFSADLTFGLGAGALTLSEQEHPNSIKLYQRAVGSSGGWTMVGTASKASFGSVTFEGITTFGEFAIGTNGPSTLLGTRGVFQSAAGGTWSDALTWNLIGGSDEDGIPDANDDVVIRSGDNIQMAVYPPTGNVGSVNNLLLLGGDNGTRLTVQANTGFYVYGIMNSDTTTLSTGLIATEGNGWITFVGSGRTLIGNNWSGDVVGWTVTFSMSDTGRILTDFKAGAMTVTGGYLMIGTPESPRNLYLDGGSEGTGTLTNNNWNPSIFVSGNIARNATLTSPCASIFWGGGIFDIGGSTISSNSLTVGYYGYYWNNPSIFRVRSSSGLLISGPGYGTWGTLEYAGTSAQTSGNELAASHVAIIISNPAGVQFLTSTSTTTCTLEGGNLTLPQDITFGTSYLYGKTHELHGAGNVNVWSSFETGHPDGIDGLLQTTGAKVIAGNATYDGTVVQHTGMLNNNIGSGYLQVIQVNNPAGVVASSSLYFNSLVLTAGNFTVNTGDTLSLSTFTANSNEIRGGGLCILNPGTYNIGHPNGLDGAVQTDFYRIISPPQTAFLFNGSVPQVTGLRTPDSLTWIGSNNYAGLTLSRSLYVPSFDLNGQWCDYTIPSRVVFSTGNFNTGLSRKLTGGGGFTLTKGGTFSTQNFAGINGALQLTGPISLGDSGHFMFYSANGPLESGTFLPDTVNDLFFYNPSPNVLSKNVNVRRSFGVVGGPLDNSVHNVTLWDGAMVERGGNTMQVAPRYHNYYDVQFDGGGTMGPEIPDSSTVLRNFGGYNWVRLTRDITINGTLTNHIMTDSFKVRVPGIVTPGYVISGYLEKPVTTLGQRQFELMDQNRTRYLYFWVDVASMTDSGSIVMKSLDTASTPPPSIPPAKKIVQYYYGAKHQGLAGLNGSVTLSYYDQDIAAAGIPDEDSLQVLQWKDSTWQVLPIISRDRNTNHLTAGPVDTLTQFLIAGTEAKGIPSFSRKTFALADTIQPAFRYDSLYVKNIGNWPLQISYISVDNPGVFGISPGSATIPMGDSVLFSFWFNGAYGGAYTSDMRFYHNGVGAVDTVSLSARSLYPSFSNWQGSRDFGNVPVGESKLDSLKLFNVGTYPLIISSIVPDNPDFGTHVSTTLTRDTIAIGDSTTLYIRFTPLSEGVKSGYLIVRSNIYQSYDNYRIYLSGTVTASQFASGQSQLDFGSIRRGQSKTDSVLIKNPGTAVLHILGSAATAAGYAITPQTRDIEVGDSAWFSVTFAPAGSGNFDGELVFNHSALTTPDSVHLIGSGIDPVFSINKTSISYGNVILGEPRKDSLVVTNTGSADLHIVSARAVDTVQFNVAPDSVTLTPGAKQTFLVQFTPNALETQSSTITFRHDATPDSTIATASGRGILPRFAVTRSLVEFGEVRVDSTRRDTITITNVGNTTLAISAIASTDSQYTISPASVILSPNGKKEFTIALTPRARGIQSAAFIFTHNGKPTHDTVRFTGTGIEPLFSAAASLPFGSVRVGQTKTDSLTVTNTGNTALTISSASSSTSMFTLTPSSAVVPKESSFTFAVTFHANARGSSTGRILFTHDAKSVHDSVILDGTGIAPLFAASRKSVTFDSTRVHHSAMDTIVVSNPGNMALTISAVNSNNTEFTLAPANAVIANGGSQTFTITFAPESRGTKTGRFVFVHDADATPDTITYAGLAVQPVFAASRSLLAFDSVRVSATKTDTFSVSNPGNAPLHIIQMQSGNAKFAVTPASARIPAGGSQTFNVAFSPTQRSQQTGSVVATHDADSSPDSVHVTGLGIQPLFAPAVASVDFGNVRTKQSKPLQLTINNPGNARLLISSVTSTDAQFTILPTSADVAAGGSQNFTVTFQPTTRGSNTADLIFTHNADSTPDTVTVTGLGIEPLFVASRRGISIDSTRVHHSMTDTVVVSNPGNMDLTISAVNSNNTEFTLLPANAVIANGGSQTFTITFAPELRGTKTGRFVFVHDADNTPDTITYSGLAVQPVFVASRSLLGFNSVRVNTMKQDSIMVTNPGNAPLHITNLELANTVFSVAPAIARIPAGGSQTFAVQFSPTARGTQSGSIVATHDADSSPDTVAVTGLGVEPVFWKQLSAANFGTVRVGTVAMELPIDIRNNGNMPLTISSAAVSTEYYAVTPSTATIAPGEGRPFYVKFKALQRGQHNDALVITHNGVSSADTIWLSGTAVEPLFVASRRIVAIDSTRVHHTKSDTVVISNPGNMDLTISAIYANSTEFTLLPADAVIAKGEAKTFTLAFAPQSRGVKTGRFILTHDADTNPDTISFSGLAVEPLFVASRPLLAFDSVRVNTTTSDTFTVANPGNAPLHISQMLSGNARFTVAPADIRIPAGTSQTFTVTFSPTQQGEQSGSLAATHDADSNHDSVRVTGLGVQPVFAASTATMDFGEVRNGHSKSLTVSVNNPGNATLTVSGIASSDGQFTITPGSASIAAGGSKEFTVKFDPAARGDKSARLIFTSNADSTPDTVTVAGRGIEPLFVVSRKSVAFDTTRVGQTMTDTMVVGNPGNTTLNITSITSAGSIFTITPTTAVIPGGGSATFTVRFQPTYGVHSDAFVFTHDASATPDSIFVNGTGVEPRFQSSSSSVAFGDVRVGASKSDSIRVQNTGNMALSLATASTTAPFTVQPATGSVLPGGMVWFVITVNPTVAGVSNGSLLLTHNGMPTVDTVRLSVRGIEPLFAVSNRIVAMGPVRVGTNKTDSITVSNPGTAAMSISNVRSSDGQFAVQPASAVIGAGSSKTFSVSIAPAAAGAKKTSLVFTHDAGTSPDTVSVSAAGVEPVFELSRRSVAFGQVRNGLQKRDSVYVKNSGSDKLMISSITTPGEVFAVAPASAMVNTGDSVKFIVTYTAKTGLQSGSIIFLHDAPSAPDTLSASGTGIEPLVRFSTRTLSYGSVRVDSSRTLQVVVQNPGSAPLQIASVVSSDAQFTVSSAPASVAPADSHTFSIRFTPSSRGITSARVIFTHNGAGGTDTVTAVGTGIEPLFAASPSTLDLGNVPLGSQKRDSVLVRNDGTSTLTVQSASAGSGVFTVLPGSATVEPAATRWFVITFAPSSPGAASAPLIFLHDAKSSRDTVVLKGTGTRPLFTPSSRTVAFGNVLVGITKFDSITVRNSDAAPLMISGTQSTDSSMAVQPSTRIIAPFDSALFRFSFTPKTAGAVAASILFTHNGSTGVDSIRVTGTGVEPRFSLAAASVQFGQVQSGMTKKDSVYVKNTGTAPLSVTSAAVSAAAFTVQPSQATILPSDSAKFIISFTAGSGVAADTVVFLHNAKSSPFRLPLTGEGVQAQFSITIDTLKFGTVRIDTLKRDSIIVRNPGTYVLTISSVSVSDSFFTITPTNAAILPGQTKTFQVTFAPRSTGVKNARVRFVHNGATLRDSVALSGRGNPLTGVNDAAGMLPKEFVLLSNYPNPFNPSTTIRFGVPQRSRVTISIYNMIGQEIARLVDGDLDAGYHEMRWNAQVPSGVYLYRMESTASDGSGARFRSVRKMLLLR